MWWQPWQRGHQCIDGSRGAREFHRPCLTHGRQGQWANVQAEHRTLWRCDGENSGDSKWFGNFGIRIGIQLVVVLGIRNIQDDQMGSLLHLTGLGCCVTRRRTSWRLGHDRKSHAPRKLRRLTEGWRWNWAVFHQFHGGFIRLELIFRMKWWVTHSDPTVFLNLQRPADRKSVV